ncbi:MAG TPA: hypothetical protein PLB49_04695 [Chitinophagaceae bacterium]|nr:hypothetical protein [Chitinophagaceae bacterium]HPH31121.1 hypothetical protein [Chitinophagaceae bacterium]
MQFKQSLVRLALILLPISGFSQITFLPQGDKSAMLLDRLEIRAYKDSLFNFSKTRPLSRQHVMNALLSADGKNRLLLNNRVAKSMTKVDQYNLRRIMANNMEYLPDSLRSAFQAKKPFLKNFYTSPANLYEVHVKDFDLVINPVIQVTVSKEKDNSESLFQNTRGLTLRGRIANKIGFATYLTDNQERVPFYVRDFVTARHAVPGAGFYKSFKGTGYDYFDARGYLTFNVTRYIDVAFGYDRNFIGNGHRSLFLSDFGNSNLFLKLNTRIWKFNYQNLFMELHNADNRLGDRLIGKKYAAMHHLDVAVTKWLNVGLFEGVVFGRPNRFDFGYLNPIIFYRSVEQQNGSFDNSVAGLDVKANLPHKIQVYGQLMLDEFLLSEIKNNRGWWANKWGLQFGAKYIDAFGIPNLDLQLEHNRVRPFTYSHRDSVANYTHYNQPLAHPLGANFREWIAIARYQPAPKWLITGKLIAYTQGRDSSDRSFGSNIFYPNVAPFRQADFGYEIGSGWKTAVFIGSFLVSYEWKENLFFELSALVRKQETKTAPIVSGNTSVISLGLRWNMHRREFDF